MTTQVATVGVKDSPAGTQQWVYDFAEGSREMRDLLGGKGAGVAEMTRILGPDMVPPGSRSRPRPAWPTCAATA